MSTDDHTMTILTGAVFAVVIGVSVQNSSWLMDQFAPKVYEGAAADAYVMRAGHSQNLDVLSNDDFASDASFRIVDGPACGTATFVKDKIAFIAPSTCTGEVTFSYCVETNGTCEPAEVALNIRGVAGSTTQVAEVKKEEVPKPRIKRIQRKKPSKQDERTVADASKPYLPTDQIPAAGRLAPPDERAPRLTQAAGVVAPPLLAPDFDKAETTVQAKIDTTLPLLPFNAVTDVVALADAETVTTRNSLGLHTRTDTRLRGDCSVRLETQVQTGGIIKLSVDAPCFAGQAGRVQHAGLAFDIKTDKTGAVELEIPAFDTDAEMLVFFGNLQNGARIVQTVPEMKRMQRVALVWKGKAELGLHAFEFGAQNGSRGHVNPVNPRDYQTALEQAGGYLDRMEIRNGTHADIYTLPAGHSTANGAVALAVATRGQACEGDISFMTLHAEPGNEVTSRAYELTADACRLISQASPDQNLVPELKLAVQNR